MRSTASQVPRAPAPSESLSRWQRGRRVIPPFNRRRLALTGAVVIVAFAATALGAPWLAPYHPQATNWSKIRKPADAHNWLGTDDLGRDVLSRVIWGAQVSLLAGVLSVLLAMLAGVPLGVLSGSVSVRFGSVSMRMTDGLRAFPFLILAIALAATLSPSLTNATCAIGLAAVPGFVRLTRGQVLAVREEDYVQGARAVGASDLRIFWRYILPNS